MAENVNVEQLVAQSGKLDKGGKVEGRKPADAAKAFDALLAGGRKAVDQILRMIREVDDGQDWQARYFLHGLSHHVCGPDKAKQRDLLTAALVAKIESDAPGAVRGALIRELQVFADESALEVLGKCLADDELYTWAAGALVTIGGAAAAGELRKALPAATGRKKATIIQDLGLLGDVEATDAIREAVSDGDLMVRLAACRALAELADEGAVDLLIKAASAKGWERTQAAKACLVLAEKLAAAGRKAPAEKIYRHLAETRGDDEKYLAEIAASALQ